MSIYGRFANAIVGSVVYFTLAVYASGGALNAAKS
jgi:hypothetical protein